MKSIPGYHEDHKCNVYDLFFQTSQCKAAVEDTEPYFYSLQMAFNRFLRHLPDTESVFFGYPREQMKKRKEKVI